MLNFFVSNVSVNEYDPDLGCGSTCKCPLCEELGADVKRAATANKHAFLYLNVCFDSCYYRHIFKGSATNESYTSSNSKLSSLSIKTMTPMKILEKAVIPPTVRNINSMYSVHAEKREQNWSEIGVSGFHVAFYSKSKLKRIHFDLQDNTVSFKGLSCYDEVKFSLITEDVELKYNKDLAQFFNCYMSSYNEPNIHATFSRTPELNCSLLRNNRTYDTFIFKDPIDEQVLKFKCYNTVDGYSYTSGLKMIEIRGVMAAMYDSNHNLYAHVFAYFPKDPSDNEMSIVIDGMCKILKLYMLTDEDCESLCVLRPVIDYTLYNSAQVSNKVHVEGTTMQDVNRSSMERRCKNLPEQVSKEVCAEKTKMQEKNCFSTKRVRYDLRNKDRVKRE